MKKLLLAAVLFAAPAGAWAADGTTTITEGGSAGTQTITNSPDGSNVVLHQIMCDRTTVSQCQNINSSGQIAIQPPPSLPLPTGAATAANQEVTTAGTSALSAQAVQGVTGGVALPATLAGTTVPLPTNASQETGGNLATIATNTGTTATNTGTTATNTGTTATNTGTIAGAVSGGVMQNNIKQVNGVTTSTGAGATGTGSQRVTVAQDTTTIAGSAPGTPLLTNPQAATSGGWSIASAIVPANTTAVVVKASAGQVGPIDVTSISQVPVFLKIYNATSATCGSGTPVARYVIAGAGSPGHKDTYDNAIGDAYGTGITYCITAGIADNDATAPAASTYLVNVHWK